MKVGRCPSVILSLVGRGGGGDGDGDGGGDGDGRWGERLEVYDKAMNCGLQVAVAVAAAIAIVVCTTSGGR